MFVNSPKSFRYFDVDVLTGRMSRIACDDVSTHTQKNSLTIFFCTPNFHTSTKIHTNTHTHTHIHTQLTHDAVKHTHTHLKAAAKRFVDCGESLGHSVNGSTLKGADNGHRTEEVTLAKENLQQLRKESGKREGRERGEEREREEDELRSEEGNDGRILFDGTKDE